MKGFSGETIYHLNSKRGGRTFVVGLFTEETQRRFDKGVKTLFGRKVRTVSRHSCPIKRSSIHRVVARFTLHQCQLTAHIVFNVFEFFPVVAPCHHVEMRTNRSQSLRMCFVKVFLYPRFVDLVGATVSSERVHITTTLFKFLK